MGYLMNDIIWQTKKIKRESDLALLLIMLSCAVLDKEAVQTIINRCSIKNLEILIAELKPFCEEFTNQREEETQIDQDGTLIILYIDMSSVIKSTIYTIINNADKIINLDLYNVDDDHHKYGYNNTRYLLESLICDCQRYTKQYTLITSAIGNEYKHFIINEHNFMQFKMLFADKIKFLKSLYDNVYGQEYRYYKINNKNKFIIILLVVGIISMLSGVSVAVVLPIVLHMTLIGVSLGISVSVVGALVDIFTFAISKSDYCKPSYCAIDNVEESYVQQTILA
jgi:hypothetical protein